MKRFIPYLTRGWFFTVCGVVHRTPAEHRRTYRELYRLPGKGSL